MLRRTLSVLLLLLLLVGCGGGGIPSVPAPEPLPDEITYVGMGASDAVGVGAFPLTEGYVYQLADRLRQRAQTVTLRNVGISGAHIEDIVARALPDAVAADPDVVTLWTGANDVVGGADPDAFAAALDFVLDGLRTGTGALVFVADLPDLTQALLFRVLPDPDVTLGTVRE